MSTISQIDGAPEGARRYTGSLGMSYLAQLNNAVNFRSRKRESTGIKAIQDWFTSAVAFEESGFHSHFFNDQLHPEVDGYEWYRGYRIVVESGKVEVIIYEPWIWPQENRRHLVLVVGDEISEDIVFQVILDYVHGRLQSMGLTKL